MRLKCPGESWTLTGSLPLLGLYLCHIVALFSTGQALVHRLYQVSFLKKIDWCSLRAQGALHTLLPEHIQDAPLCGWARSCFLPVPHPVQCISPILTPQLTPEFFSRSTSSRVALCLNLTHPSQGVLLTDRSHTVFPINP